MQFRVKNMQDWQQVLNEILPLQHNILLLKGNLGAGKTTFTSLLLEKLQSSDEVNSPTYSIVNEYDTPNGKVFHFDLYRLKNLREAFDIGIEEYLERGYLSVIEWPEIYEKELEGLPFHEITIENTGTERLVNFS